MTAITTTATVNGTLYKRTSKTMAYTHAVVAAHSKAGALRRANDKSWNKLDRSNFAYYVGKADARVAGLTEAEYVAAKLAERVARAEATDETPFVLSWSQSLKNAERAAHTARSNDYYLMAAVVPAGFVGSL